MKLNFFQYLSSDLAIVNNINYSFIINNHKPKMSQSQLPIIILDANAFITGSGLLDIGATHQLVTTSEVMDQLRDVKTRQMLQKFLFKIQQKQPQNKSVQFIKQFAKKTGDLASLSEVDINLLALAHTLYIKKGLEEKLRKTPPPMKEKQQKSNNQQFEQQSSSQEQDQQTEQIVWKGNQQKTKEETKKQQQNHKKETKQQNKNLQDNDDDDDGWIVVPKSKPKKRQQSDDDLGQQQGWITPKNFDRKMAEGPTFISTNQVQQQQQQDQTFGISLMTADFAMQNVALQVGIQIKSLDGRRIKQVRRFILECYLCWKQYKVEDNLVKLCKQCGYNSLSKIAYSINPKGEMILHRKKGWKPNQKVLQWKQKKYQQQQKKKKHQHGRRKKQPSIFDV